MKVAALAEKLDLKIFSGSSGLENEITGGYVSDLLSDVMGFASEGQVWITLQTHQNVVAIASLKDLAAVILVKGFEPDEETLAHSEAEGIPVLGTKLNTFEIAGMLYNALNWNKVTSYRFRVTSSGLQVSSFSFKKYPESGIQYPESSIKKYRVSSINFIQHPVFKADLHIHTVLSPCADLEMTPANIVKRAVETGLNIIGITDHNSTRNALLVKKLGEKEGLLVLTGAEITTKEEVHCLVFTETEEQLSLLQHYIDENITRIPNPDGHFGYQPVVDKDDNIIEMVPYYLHASLKTGIDELREFIKNLNGLFIPAHVDRPANGLFSQLGFLPPKLNPDALAISKFSNKKDVIEHYNLPSDLTLIRNSDAHFVNQIGEIYTSFQLNSMIFNEIRMALKKAYRRFTEIR